MADDMMVIFIIAMVVGISLSAYLWVETFRGFGRSFDRLLEMRQRPARQIIMTIGEDGIWRAEVPSLPGCKAEGKNQAEVARNIRKAIKSHDSRANQ